MLGVWVALSVVSATNGCMVLAPAPRAARGPRPHFMRRDWQLCDSDVLDDGMGRLAARRVAVPMQPGDVLLFDSLLPHGTDKNRSSDHRWALQYHFRGADTTSSSDDAERLAIFGGEGRGATC